MEKKVISDVMFSILTDAISAVTILSVRTEKNLEGSTAIYITTDDLSTVDKSKLVDMVEKNSDEHFVVEVLIPETKFIEGKHVENTDSVSIFIEEI